MSGPAAFAALGAAVHERARRRHAGALTLRPTQWERLASGAHLGDPEPDPHRYAVVWRDGDGLLGGYLVHRALPPGTATDRLTVEVVDLQAASPRAYRELWRHLCEQDRIATARWDTASVDEPLPWLLADHRAVRLEGSLPMTWLRMLDVPAALGARTYPVADTMRLLVHDPAGYAAGRWHLDTADPTAPRATRLDAVTGVDVETDACGLASVYLGGVDPRVLARGGRLTEHSAGAAGRLARLFAAPSVPWNALWF